jgi:hypothetical protein
MSFEPAPPSPVSEKSRLESTLRIVRNVKALLENHAVHASNALALLEGLDWLTGMEARLGQDIAVHEAS